MVELIEPATSASEPDRAPVWHVIGRDPEPEPRWGPRGPGARLPSEHDLAERFGVNRHTVRAAFARLAELGLVVPRRGSGVFVAERPPEYAINRDTKWTEIEAALAATPSGRLVTEYRRRAVGRIADLLRLPEGAELVVLETLRSATERVATYGYHAFEAARFAGIGEAFRRHGSFTAAIAACGVPAFFRQSTWIDCRMPRRIEAESLRTGLDQPVMVMSYVDADEDGRPILFGTAVLPSGSVTLRVDS